MYKLRPLGDRVVVRELPKEEKTKGGIFIPQSAAEQNKGFCRGQVVAIGPGRNNDRGELVPMQAQVGDVVVFSPYAGTEVILESDLSVKYFFFIVRDGDIQAVLEEEAPVTVESLLGSGTGDQGGTVTE